MRKNIVIAVLVTAIAGASAAYVMARPADEQRAKIDGVVYVLPKEFLLNVRDGRYAKLSVALVLDEDQSTSAAGGHAAARPPEGFGTLPQEAVIRDIVTDVVTNRDGDQLISADGRDSVKQVILQRIRRSTDVRAHKVLITDIAVQ